MNEIYVTGMVIGATPIGEYDRRIVLLTRQRGKISAFARGARKPNSAFVGLTSPFTFGEFELFAGRSSYTLKSAEVKNYFAELRTDVTGAYYGMYFLDLAGYFSREGNDESQTLLLLYQTLRALTRGQPGPALVRRIYELKLITLNGEGPQVFKCQSCGRSELSGACGFSVEKGGVVCGRCAPGTRVLPLGQSTLYTLQFIISAPVEKLYSFMVKPAVQAELERIMEAYLTYYIDRRFRSKEILETITKES